MFKLARDAMRTRFEIVIADGGDEADHRAAAEAALDEVERVEAQLSAYREDAELYRVNHSAAKSAVKVDPRLFAFLKRAQQLSALTDGAFDMTVGPLMRVWKLAGASGSEAEVIPAEADIASALVLVGMKRVLKLDDAAQSVGFAREGVWLDPGAIGKGYALERAANLLRDMGVRSALIHGGTSTAVAIGAPENAAGWRIAIQHPTEANEHLAEVLLKDSALSVSAVHGKTFRAAGKTFGHVLDPRTGRPVESNVLAAVVTESATDADALSTAALVGGSSTFDVLDKEWPEASFLVAYASARGNLHCAKSGSKFYTGSDGREET